MDFHLAMTKFTYRKPQRPTRYQARQARRDKNAAWAADAQARLKTFFEAQRKAEETPLEQWDDKRLAEAVREIALMADTDSLAPDRSRWAGAADVLMTAADRIEKEEKNNE